MPHNPDVYAKTGVYDASLPPYRFDNGQGGLVDDEELVRRTLQSVYGEPTRTIDALDIGAGSGRMSQIIQPYARQLTVTDKYGGMLAALRRKIPEARVVQADTRDLPDVLEPSRQFNFVGAYWTLSYPIGECLETIEDDAIVPVADLEAGVEQATAMVDRLVDYVKPNDGVFNAYFFDSESPEQRAVTHIWEQLGPDPGGRRSFTREIAAAALEAAASIRGYNFEVKHHTGIAPFESREAMVGWFALCHAKGKSSLINTAVFAEETSQLADEHSNTDGTVDLPVGMYEFTLRSQ